MHVCDQRFYIFLFIFSFAIFEAESQAQTQSSSLIIAQSGPRPELRTSIDSKAAIKSTPRFSLTTITSIETNLEESGSTKDESSTSIEITPQYSFSNGFSVALYTAFEHDFNAEINRTKSLNSIVFLNSAPFEIAPHWTASLSAQGLLPTEEKSRKEDTLRGAAGFIASTTYSYKTFNLLSRIKYSLNTFKYIHEFDRNVNSESNLSYRLRHRLDYTLNLNEKWELELMGYYQMGMTYTDVVREVYKLQQGINYSLSKKVSLGAYHATGGKLFDANGSDSNLEFYNKRNSTVGMSLTALF